MSGEEVGVGGRGYAAVNGAFKSGNGQVYRTTAEALEAVGLSE